MVMEPGMAAGCVPEAEALGVVALAVSFSVIENGYVPVFAVTVEVPLVHMAMVSAPLGAHATAAGTPSAAGAPTEPGSPKM